MKKILLSIAVATGLVLSASAASASDVFQTIAPVGPASVQIVGLGTDAMGADTFANRNAEYVLVKNFGPDVDITGWRTEDAWAYGDNSPSQCNTFKVKTTNVDATLVSGAVVTLPAGHSLKVYGGSGTPGKWGTTHYAFMNSNVGCGANGHYLTNKADDVYLMSGATKVAHVRYNYGDNYEHTFAPVS